MHNKNPNLEKLNFNFLTSLLSWTSTNLANSWSSFSHLREFLDRENMCQALGRFHICPERHHKLSSSINCLCNMKIRSKKQQKEISPALQLVKPHTALPLAGEIWQFPRIGSWTPVILTLVSLSTTYSLETTTGWPIEKHLDAVPDGIPGAVTMLGHAWPLSFPISWSVRSGHEVSELLPGCWR